jgi:heat shock protein HslJ
MNQINYLSVSILIAMGIFSACTSSKTAKPAAGGSEQLFMYKWILIELEGSAVAGDTKAHLLFYPGQVTRVAGNAGCNRLTGSIALAGESGLKFSPLAVTRMACMETTVEPQFLKALEKVNDWRIADNELFLYEGDKLLAKFRGVMEASEDGGGPK